MRPRNTYCAVSASCFNRTALRGAFSLVELLVVIGIIVVLVSLLLPTILGVRQSGWAVTCQSHQRRLMMAFRAFALDQEHEGCLPGGYFDTISNQPVPWKRDWLIGDDPNIGNNALQLADAPQKGKLFPYVGDASVYLCPAYQPAFAGGRAGSNGRFDYTAFLIFTGARLVNVKLEAQFHYSDGTIGYDVFTPVICEEEPKGGINDDHIEGGHSNTDQIGHYHRGGGYYAAIDGSVHLFTEPSNANCWNWFSRAPSGQLKALGSYPTSGFWNTQ